jgi:hypothetical protein
MPNKPSTSLRLQAGGGGKKLGSFYAPVKNFKSPKKIENKLFSDFFSQISARYAFIFRTL